jgi:predicted nucleic acid-binding Zn ribbon protein
MTPKKAPKIKSYHCDCCEKIFSYNQLIRDGGLLLCNKCKQYCDREYPKLMAEEADEGGANARSAKE